ncbi:hypothetical protein Scel_86480 [Streptomyces cellostaticus]|nr:hypothetical protein Scel_86480 [Streptomyces cellostaticus]
MPGTGRWRGWLSVPDDVQDGWVSRRPVGEVEGGREVFAFGVVGLASIVCQLTPRVFREFLERDVEIVDFLEFYFEVVGAVSAVLEVDFLESFGDD